MSADNEHPICCEIGTKEWRIHANGETRTIPAEREQLVAALRDFNGTVYCLLESRGVSVRRVTLPAGPAAGRSQLLRFQIEKEFPLSPDELAWWHRELPSGGQGIEYLVIAVRKESIAPAQEILEAAGIEGRFSLTVLAAAGPNPQATAILLSDDTRCELVELEHQLPKCFRFFPAHAADQAASKYPYAKTVASAAEGFHEFAKRGALDQLPVLNVSTHGADAPSTRIALPWQWIALATTLALGLFLLRYVEAWIQQPKLEKQLAEFEARLTDLPAINQEVGFLQHIQENQPPYLAALAVLADSCPRGTKIESVALDRRGDLTFRGQMQSSQNAAELRRKLIESGLFTAVVLDEQNPVKNRREVKVRFSARWNTSRKVKSATLKRIDAAKSKDAKTSRSSASRPSSRPPFPR